MKAHISGFGAYLPGPPVDNQELARRFSLNADWISLFLGNEKRHFTTDLATGDIVQSLADIAEKAGLAALADAGLDTADIGFILLATATPDDLMPATVNIVAERFRRARIATYQLQSGCTGALQALALGSALIRSGDHRRGLVIGADSCAKYMDPARDYTKLAASELVNYALFGDGAGAVVLDRELRGRNWAIERLTYEIADIEQPPGQHVAYRGIRESEGQMVREDYKAIERLVPQLAADLVAELQGGAEAIDWFLPPQLSGRMTQMIIRKLGLPKERCLNCVHLTGNNGNALPFLQLAMLHETFSPGERALGLAIESSRWMRGGYVISNQMD